MAAISPEPDPLDSITFQPLDMKLVPITGLLKVPQELIDLDPNVEFRWLIRLARAMMWMPIFQMATMVTFILAGFPFLGCVVLAAPLILGPIGAKQGNFLMMVFFIWYLVILALARLILIGVADSVTADMAIELRLFQAIQLILLIYDILVAIVAVIFMMKLERMKVDDMKILKPLLTFCL